MILGLGSWKANLTVLFGTGGSSEGLLELPGTRGPSFLALLSAVFFLA